MSGSPRVWGALLSRYMKIARIIVLVANLQVRTLEYVCASAAGTLSHRPRAMMNSPAACYFLRSPGSRWPSPGSVAAGELRGACNRPYDTVPRCLPTRQHHSTPTFAINTTLITSRQLSSRQVMIDVLTFVAGSHRGGQLAYCRMRTRESTTDGQRCPLGSCHRSWTVHLTPALLRANLPLPPPVADLTAHRGAFDVDRRARPPG